VPLLLDSHTVIWWYFRPNRLSDSVRSAIGETGADVWVSAVSAWELGLKHAKGKLEEAAPLLERWSALIGEQGFAQLAFTAEHAIRSAALPAFHSDPFDRALVAQALCENLRIVSIDTTLDSYSITRLWA
jgi:PIN domain nuclease of toxin-antitoxin system